MIVLGTIFKKSIRKSHFTIVWAKQKLFLRVTKRKSENVVVLRKRPIIGWLIEIVCYSIDREFVIGIIRLEMKTATYIDLHFSLTKSVHISDWYSHYYLIGDVENVRYPVRLCFLVRFVGHTLKVLSSCICFWALRKLRSLEALKT